MKNVLAISVFFCSAVSVAAAQSGNLMTVKLPNAAIVGTATLAPGEYTITAVAGLGNAAVIEFSNATGIKATVFAQEIPANSEVSDRTSVILKSDGGHLQVQQLWIADHSYGFQIGK